MMLAWVLASVMVGQLIPRVGRVRPTAVAGMAVAAGGLWLMAGMGPQTEYPVVARNLVIIGLGLGSALSSFAVAAQNAAPAHQTGVATALGTFARSMGGTVASAGLGGLLDAQLGTTAAAGVKPAMLGEALRATFLDAAKVGQLFAKAAELLHKSVVFDEGHNRLTVAGDPAEGLLGAVSFDRLGEHVEQGPSVDNTIDHLAFSQHVPTHPELP
jgi:MFS family permease